VGREEYDEAMAMKDACRPCVEIEEMLGVQQVCVLVLCVCLCCVCACVVCVLVLCVCVYGRARTRVSA